jgi:hypothetical protein
MKQPLLSLAHLTVLDADPVCLIQSAAEAGFNAVGLRVVPPMPTDIIVPVVGDLPLQRQITVRRGFATAASASMSKQSG